MKTLAQFVVIGAAALVVGFTANGLRGKGALSVSKNYFDTGTSLIPTKHEPRGDTSSATRDAGAPTLDGRSQDGGAPASAGGAEPASSSPEPATATDDAHVDHPYQTITFDDIVALLDDPLTQAGLNVVVDARNEEHFAEGHLPGAMLCNPYQVAKYIDRDVGGQTMLDRVLAAEKVVVYCGGGDCADSAFMCRELLELDVPYDAIFLYEGGWKDWTTRKGPIEKGAE